MDPTSSVQKRPINLITRQRKPCAANSAKSSMKSLQRSSTTACLTVSKDIKKSIIVVQILLYFVIWNSKSVVVVWISWSPSAVTNRWVICIIVCSSDKDVPDIISLDTQSHRYLCMALWLKCFSYYFRVDRATWAPSQYKDRLIYIWRFPC